MKNKSQIIITIDGPAGSGKSTVAHKLAKKLGWIHVNTGAIYRTFAWIAESTAPTLLESPAAQEIIAQIANQIDEHYKQDDANQQFFLNAQNITTSIYAPNISSLASKYGQNKDVRTALLPIQRKIIEQYPHVIVDGRDMGTVVCPTASIKIFLTADLHTRVKRRALELQENNLHVNFDTLFKEMQERDLRDITRDIAPTVPASDAIVIDSSNRAANEIVDEIFVLFCNLNI